MLSLFVQLFSKYSLDFWAITHRLRSIVFVKCAECEIAHFAPPSSRMLHHSRYVAAPVVVL